MRSKQANMNSVAVVAVVVAFATAALAVGGTIIPIDQDRYIEAFVWSECELGTIDTDEAKGFAPFNASSQTLQQCGAIFVTATASQQSEIGASSMTAYGIASSEGESPTGIHTYAVSVFDVTFQLPAASNFQLDGVIGVDGGFPGGVTSLVRLTGPRDQIVFEHILVGAGGTDSQVVENAGVLEPGQYTLRAYADISYLDIINVIPFGEVYFDFTFVTAAPCPGNLDGDGDVGAADLAILLGTWGVCPGCLADFNGDNVVDAADLAVLLGHWGPCPV